MHTPNENALRELTQGRCEVRFRWSGPMADQPVYTAYAFPLSDAQDTAEGNTREAACAALVAKLKAAR